MTVNVSVVYSLPSEVIFREQLILVRRNDTSNSRRPRPEMAFVLAGRLGLYETAILKNSETSYCVTSTFDW